MLEVSSSVQDGSKAHTGSSVSESLAVSTRLNLSTVTAKLSDSFLHSSDLSSDTSDARKAEVTSDYMTHSATGSSLGDENHSRTEVSGKGQDSAQPRPSSACRWRGGSRYIHVGLSEQRQPVSSSSFLAEPQNSWRRPRQPRAPRYGSRDCHERRGCFPRPPGPPGLPIDARSLTTRPTSRPGSRQSRQATLQDRRAAPSREGPDLLTSLTARALHLARPGLGRSRTAPPVCPRDWPVLPMRHVLRPGPRLREAGEAGRRKGTEDAGRGPTDCRQESAAGPLPRPRRRRRRRRRRHREGARAAG